MAVIGDELRDLDGAASSPSPSTSAGARRRVGDLTAAAVLSLAAAAIHFSFAGVHFDERASHGAFFVLAGAAQAAWAVLALRSSTPSRRIALLSLFNLAIVGVWVASRTVGVDGMKAEPVRYPDALASALASGTIVLALLRPALKAVVVGALAVVVAGGSGYAMTPRFADAHVHGDAAAEADGVDHHAEAAAGTPLTGDTPCERSGPPASPAQVTTNAQGHSHRGPSPQQPIDRPTRERLAQQQVIARGVAAKYPTVAEATKRGYKMSTAYIPCIGAHYTNAALAARFDPATPAELLFDGTTPDAKLVGLSYLVYHPGGAPEGFAGPNDVWHQHNANGGLCFNREAVVIAGEESSAEQCRALGGRKVELTDVWMLHDWIVPGWECSWGVFAPECPELGGRTGASAWD